MLIKPGTSTSPSPRLMLMRTEPGAHCTRSMPPSASMSAAAKLGHPRESDRLTPVRAIIAQHAVRLQRQESADGHQCLDMACSSCLLLVGANSRSSKDRLGDSFANPDRARI